MSLAIIYSRARYGLAAPLVTVEVHLSNGLPAFQLVGLPETSVKEARGRVRSALLNSGFQFPDKRITVNLAPADLPKEGGRFDLAIALGIIVASGQLPEKCTDHFEFCGELALSGEVRPAPQAEARLNEAARLGFSKAAAPGDARGKGRPKGVEMASVRRIDELVRLIAAEPLLRAPKPADWDGDEPLGD